MAAIAPIPISRTSGKASVSSSRFQRLSARAVATPIRRTEGPKREADGASMSFPSTFKEMKPVSDWLSSAVVSVSSDITKLVTLAQNSAIPAIEQVIEEANLRERAQQRQQMLRNSSKARSVKLSKASMWIKEAVPARREALRSELETLQAMLKSPMIPLNIKSRPLTGLTAEPFTPASPSPFTAVSPASAAAPATSLAAREETLLSARCAWPRTASYVPLAAAASPTVSTSEGPRCAWPKRGENVAVRAAASGGPAMDLAAQAAHSTVSHSAVLARSSNGSNLGRATRETDGISMAALSAAPERVSFFAPRCSWPRKGASTSPASDVISSRSEAVSKGGLEGGVVLDETVAAGPACPWPRASARTPACTSVQQSEAVALGPRCSWPRNAM